MRTHDLYLASFLLATGHALTKTEREGRRVTFVFEPEPDSALILGWHSGSALVSAQKFAQSVRSMKSLVATGAP